MTPVMERCPCSWPVAECLKHSPPATTEPPAPDDDPDDPDDPDDLTQPPTATYILAVSSVAIIAGWAAVGAAVWGAWKLGAWAVGLLA